MSNHEQPCAAAAAAAAALENQVVTAPPIQTAVALPTATSRSAVSNRPVSPGCCLSLSYLSFLKSALPDRGFVATRLCARAGGARLLC
jgi:hypothetical protein